MPKSQPIIILTTGRTGSSLLQHLLNTSDELVIWGEHMGFLRSLSEAHNLIEKCPWIDADSARGEWLLKDHRDIDPKRWTAWDGSFSKQEFLDGLRLLTNHLFARDIREDQRWGFKEIRYRKFELVQFINELYPEAQFILLLRNPVDVCASFTSIKSKKFLNEGEDEWDLVQTAREIANEQIKLFFKTCVETWHRFQRSTQFVFYEDLVHDSFHVMENLARFLELKKGFPRQSVELITSKDLVSQRAVTEQAAMREIKEACSHCLQPEIHWYEQLRNNPAKVQEVK